MCGGNVGNPIISGFGDVVEMDEVDLFKNKRNIGIRMVKEHFWVVEGIIR